MPEVSLHFPSVSGPREPWYPDPRMVKDDPDTHTIKHEPEDKGTLMAELD